MGMDDTHEAQIPSTSASPKFRAWGHFRGQQGSKWGKTGTANLKVTYKILQTSDFSLFLI